MGLDGDPGGSTMSGGPTDDAIKTYVITHIDDAIDKGWVIPYYQPVIRSLTGKLCGLEALARWEDPTYGLLSPASFIPALEEARLIHLLDCSIVEQVCRQYRECVDDDKPIVPISLNFSRLDFDLCDMFSVVEKAAREYSVPRRMLNIEITESALGSKPDYMASVMRQFHDAGYQVWMDDFGSGYSTLNVLKDFDFDELKIDMNFLSNFGSKSKIVLASVVDMAKKLGVETLAEGVETEEHLDYLRRIGCEKMQGYLFGKPKPYDPAEAIRIAQDIGVESAAERLYIREIGAVNTLSLSERDLTAGNSSKSYVTSMPLAIVEYIDDTFTILDSNLVFRESIANIGIPSIEILEQRMNNLHLPIARQLRRAAETIATEKYARVDYPIGGVPCAIRIKHISSRNGRAAALVSLDDTLELSERKRHHLMDDARDVIFSVYEHVDLIHLDDRYTEPVFGNINLTAQYDPVDFDKLGEHFANAEVYIRDRERYIEFMNHDTMIERLIESDLGYLIDFFRIRQRGGNYVWKLFGLVRVTDRPGNLVMLCIRSTHWEHDSLLQTAYDESAEEDTNEREPSCSGISDGSLWRALTHDKNINLFWKDEERRFVGANKAFLDYYGFASLNVILGKTDEDMGWHIDPTPFQKDELSVLRDGAVIEDATGHCIAHGEVRDIVANKRPVYRNGQIVGLVGYFIDVANLNGSEEFTNLPMHDVVTGTLNYTGLEAATWQYVDTYRRQGIDFAMISINVESFEGINGEFGYSFGEKVLRRVAETLVGIAGDKRVIGHVYADRFVILSQGDTDEELQNLCDSIEQNLMGIAQVDGTPCTVFALASFSRFSELGNIEDMKRRNSDSRLKRRIRWTGEQGDEGLSNSGDVITSTLL